MWRFYAGLDPVTLLLPVAALWGLLRAAANQVRHESAPTGHLNPCRPRRVGLGQRLERAPAPTAVTSEPGTTGAGLHAFRCSGIAL